MSGLIKYYLVAGDILWLLNNVSWHLVSIMNHLQCYSNTFGGFRVIDANW